MSIVHNNAIIGSSGNQNTTYNISRSLRLRKSATAYLNRTPSSASNRKTWTWSGWVKRGSLDSEMCLLGLITASTAFPQHFIRFKSDNTLSITRYDSSGTLVADLATTQVFRDPSAWYHIVAVWDTTQATANNRLRLYVNGSEVTAFASRTNPTQNMDGDINNTVPTGFGGAIPYSTVVNLFDGYMAEVNFVDGQQLDATSFGKFDTKTGVWIPKKYTGTYGTNGFYLPFTYPTASSSYAATFNGSNQYLQFNGESGFAFGSNDFTIETWINPTRNDTGVIWDARPASTNGNYGLWYFNGNSGVLEYNVNGNALMTSPTISTNAWTHVALVRASGTLKMYINGVNVASASDGTSYGIPSGRPVIGVTGWNLAVAFFSGKMSNYRVVNGTAVYTSNFLPSTSPLTAVTNTKLLTLQNSSLVDNSSNAYTINNINGVTIGADTPFVTVRHITADQSGNSNHWSGNNISLTAGSTYDSMTDVPTLTSATAANYCVLNALQPSGTGLVTPTNGNLTCAVPVNNNTVASIVGTIGVTSGKWYYEFRCPESKNIGGTYLGMGYSPAMFTGANQYVGNSGFGYGFLVPDTTGTYQANARVNGTNTGIGTAFTAATTDVFMVAADFDNGRMWLGRNGTWLAGDPAAGTGASITGIVTTSPLFPAATTYRDSSWNNTVQCNFGQQGFAYTPPSGFLALNTYNLPTPAIPAGNKVMDVTTFGSSGGSQNIVNSGGFKPDLIWQKSRGGPYGTAGHFLTDTVRGLSYTLSSNGTGAEGNNTGFVISANSNGWTQNGSGIYFNGDPIVGWQWQAGQGTTSSNTNGSITSTVSVNASAGFSIVSFTGTAASSATVGHGLGVAPSMIIWKYRSATSDWAVGHSSLNGGSNPWSYWLKLNGTNAQAADTGPFNNTAPTSSVFTIGNYNSNGTALIAYCWAEVPGFSKFGSYTGNGSSDGPFVYTGFRPKFILIKNTANSAAEWTIWDTSRNTYNLTNANLMPNSSAAEDNYNTGDVLSNGFKLRSTYGNTNGNGQNLIYAAFAENPFKYSLAR